MSTDSEILSNVNVVIREIIPDAEVFLFGSRVTGNWNEESDWDILILSEKKYPRSVKRLIHDKLFSFGLSNACVFHFILATKDEWQNHPAYYSLQKGIGDQYIGI
jgi:predicted nucleotidyltransferase